MKKMKGLILGTILLVISMVSMAYAQEGWHEQAEASAVDCYGVNIMKVVPKTETVQKRNTGSNRDINTTVDKDIANESINLNTTQDGVAGVTAAVAGKEGDAVAATADAFAREASTGEEAAEGELQELSEELR